MTTATAIIAAAGQGTRFGGTLPKQFATLGDRPIIEHTLAAFEQAARITAIVLAVAEEYREDVAKKLQLKFPKLRHVVAGGARRQDSVFNALKVLHPHADDIVAVHCGARPLIRSALIDRSVAVAAAIGGCIIARPAHDTMKRVAAGELITETVDRSTLWMAQTPQTFRAGLLRRALEQALADGVTGTDEAALVERLGEPVQVIMGDPWNIKITTPEDLALAEVFMRSGLV